jgi:hypothetical protein
MCAHLEEGQHVAFFENGVRVNLPPCTTAKAIKEASRMKAIKLVRYMPGKNPEKISLKF